MLVSVVWVGEVPPMVEQKQQHYVVSKLRLPRLHAAEQVPEQQLPGSVLTHCYWGVHPLHVALLHQHLQGFLAQGLDLALLQGLTAFQLLNPAVQLRLPSLRTPQAWLSGMSLAMLSSCGPGTAAVLLAVHEPARLNFKAAS